MLRYLVNFVFPPRCAGCGIRLPIDGRARLCSACLAGIERLHGPLCVTCGIPLYDRAADGGEPSCGVCRQTPPHFTAARAVTRYRSSEEATAVVPSLIRRHKYGRDQSLSHALAECLTDPLPLAENGYDLVLPVPLHPERLRWRGFNQAALLGMEVARRLGSRLAVNVLMRTRATPAQTAQDRRQRQRNVHDAFRVARPAAVASRRVLLVDDVMTTGATVDECARTLLGSGARRVDVLALARAL
ncbi:MAG TPA: ComF family protein [Candidatus Binataceae bacterium]|nr:ComF family protein [Candidatus Binataceae bacterium]